MASSQVKRRENRKRQKRHMTQAWRNLVSRFDGMSQSDLSMNSALSSTTTLKFDLDFSQNSPWLVWRRNAIAL